MSHVYDVVIVGGGAAGLGSAWRLEELDVLVLEREQRLGGRMKSSGREGCWLNLGAHLFPGGDSPIGRLIDAVGLDRLPVPGSKTGLFFEGKLYATRHVESYPFVLPLTIRERLALVRVGLALMRGVRRWHAATKVSPSESPASRRQRLTRVESRRTFADLLVQLPERVASIFASAARRSAGEAGEQTAGAGLSLFGALWLGKGSGSVTNVRGGAGALADAWEQRLGSSVVLGANVTDVSEEASEARISYATAQGQYTVRARKVIVAVPAPVARQIVRDIPREVDQALASVSYGPFVCMGFTTDEERPMPWDDIYAITTPGMAFDMLFNHANPIRAAFQGRQRGGSFMCYAGGESARRLLGATEVRIREVFLSDLTDMFPQLRGHITEAAVQKWKFGNVFRTTATDFEEAARWNERPDAIVRLAGDYFADFAGSLAAAAESGVAAATSALADLQGSRPAWNASTGNC